MNISQVVSALEALKKERGDLEVHVYDDWNSFPAGKIVFDDGLEIDGSKFREPCIVIYSTNQPEGRTNE